MRQRWFLFVSGGGLLLWLWVVVWSGTAVATNTFLSPNAPVGTGFTYQGQLKQGGSVVTDSCDMAFRAYDQVSGGAQVGSAITQTVAVNEGLFTTSLDWGAAVFKGDGRWLDIRVRCPAGSGVFAPLTPRQNLTPAPYALHALNADYANRVVVAQSGGDFDSIQAAIDSITDNGSGQRYLVWVAPGLYNEAVTMKPYVDVQGAGEGMTFVSAPGSVTINDATIVGASSATLSHLTVENSGGSDYATGIYAVTVGFKIEHVSISVIGSTTGSYGIRHQGSTLSLDEVTVNVNGDTAVGVYQDSPGGITIQNSYIRAAGGTNAWGLRHVLTNGGGFSVEQSEIEAVGVNAYGVASGMAYELNVVESEVTAVSSALPGSGTSYAVTTNSVDYVTVARSTLEAWNGNNNRGLSLQGNPGSLFAETEVRDSTILVGDGTTAFGILMLDILSPVVEGSSVTLLNGTDNRGIQIQDGPATIRNSSITVQNGGNINYGLLVLNNSGSAIVTVDQATIVADDNTILMGGSGTPAVLVGGSRLDGGGVIVNSGSLTCAAVYDEAYLFYASSCP